MTNLSGNIAGASRQQSIRAKCFHPTGRFVEFKKEEIEQSIPDRFEQMVCMHPDRLAVKTKTESLTYDELNRAANRIARAVLRKRGAGSEPVVLLFEKGAAFIAAILGVLKAGKIYVPVDPSFPRQRIVSMLEDLQAELIVTNNENLSLSKGLIRNDHSLVNVDVTEECFNNAISISATSTRSPLILVIESLRPK